MDSAKAVSDKIKSVGNGVGQLSGQAFDNVSDLKTQICDLTKATDKLSALEEKNLINEANLTCVRQLATAYQYRAAYLLDVGRVGRQHCMTHNQMSKSVSNDPIKRIEFSKIEMEFVKANPTIKPDPTLYVEQMVKNVREATWNGKFSSYSCTGQ